MLPVEIAIIITSSIINNYPWLVHFLHFRVTLGQHTGNSIGFAWRQYQTPSTNRAYVHQICLRRTDATPSARRLQNLTRKWISCVCLIQRYSPRHWRTSPAAWSRINAPQCVRIAANRADTKPSVYSFYTAHSFCIICLHNLRRRSLVFYSNIQTYTHTRAQKKTPHIVWVKLWDALRIDWIWKALFGRHSMYKTRHAEQHHWE